MFAELVQLEAVQQLGVHTPFELLVFRRPDTLRIRTVAVVTMVVNTFCLDSRNADASAAPNSPSSGSRDGRDAARRPVRESLE